jgi:hypothetical protein
MDSLLALFSLLIQSETAKRELASSFGEEGKALGDSFR